MADMFNGAGPLRKFVKIFDLTEVLPPNRVMKKYHILLGGPGMDTVSHVIEKIMKLFDLQNITLKSGDAALPELENIHIFGFLDNIKVVFARETTNTSVPTASMLTNGNEEFKNSVIPVPLTPESNNSTVVASSTPANLNNSVSFFLNMIRSDSKQSSSSETGEQEQKQDECEVAPPPKRKRLRRHKKRSDALQDENFENGDEVEPTEQNESSTFEALYSLRENYKNPPIFKKSE